MDKKKIEFLISAGFTLDEIMTLSESREKPSNFNSKDSGNKDTPEPEKPSIEPTQSPQDDLQKKLDELTAEIKSIRGDMQKQNRSREVIETEPKQLSFSEDIEKLISEVTG